MKIWLVWQDEYSDSDTLLVAAASEKAAKQWLLNAGFKYEPEDNWYPWKKPFAKMDDSYSDYAAIVPVDVFEGFSLQEIADMPLDNPVKVAMRDEVRAAKAAQLGEDPF